MLSYLWRRFRRERQIAATMPGVLPQFRIRPLVSSGELDVCDRIGRTAGGERFTRRDLRHWIRDDGIILVALLDDELVGFCVYVPSRTALAIVHVAVDADYQLRGIGRELVLRAASHDPTVYRPVHAIVCTTDTAAQFFRAVGFQQMGLSTEHCTRRQDNRPGHLRDAWILRLPLAAYDALRRPTITVGDCDSPIH